LSNGQLLLAHFTTIWVISGFHRVLLQPITFLLAD